MELSNNNKVREFNRTFKSPTYNTYDSKIWDDKKLVKLRLDLIKEEVAELEEAIEQQDIKETMDALGDILVVTYGAFDAFGLDGDKVFDEVHNSNMSKLCQNEGEALESVDWYKQNKTEYDSPDYYEDNDKYIVYNKNTGKILKNQSSNNKWTEPDFTDTLKFSKSIFI